MYIREVITKKKGKEYTVHRLVESYKNEDGKPRQRIIMYLGKIDLPKSRFKELAFLLEELISGQTSLLHSDLDEVAKDLYHRSTFAQGKKVLEKESQDKKDFATVDLNSVTTSHVRSLGPELLANHAWNQLDFDHILKEQGFSLKEISLAKAMILGKLIAPASEHATISWFKNNTALTEFCELDLSSTGKDAFYQIGDQLYGAAASIEQALYNKETTLFSLDRRLFLFDLTNTYLEGNASNNPMAAFGHSKEKRRDCKLITLALVVDNNGFPVYSNIYKGNQSEPETLEAVLNELEKRDTRKPVIIMDRGIATANNIALLKEREYPYTVVVRSNIAADYTDEFENEEGFIPLAKGVSGKKIPVGKGCHILVNSENKAYTSHAIQTTREQRFLTDLEKINCSIKKGTLKKEEKIWTRIGRLKEKYAGIANLYELELKTETEGIVALDYTKDEEKGKEKTSLAGCYVIESSYDGDVVEV